MRTTTSPLPNLARNSAPAMTPFSSRRRAKNVVRAVAAVAILVLPLAPLSAQPNNDKDPNKLEAPQPRPPGKPAGTFIGMLSAFVLGGLVIGVNFIPSKRGHQD